MALARCADATGQRDYFTEAENWFTGLQKVYPQKIWNSTLVNFHRSGIIWESLALVAHHVPAESGFHTKIQQYVRDFEAFLARAWENDKDTWSFASARALALRWQSKAVKGKSARAKIKKWAKEHVQRFLGAGKSVKSGILARIGAGGYTCGPLQGLTSLAAVVGGAELVQVVLSLLEKDIDNYQLGPSPEGPVKAEIWIPKLANAGLETRAETLEASQSKLVGSFFRDKDQLKMEKRSTLRVDDVVQCMVAMTQALKTLEGIQGVEVQKPGQEADEAEKSIPHEAEL
jgi:hypothetical protein